MLATHAARASDQDNAYGTYHVNKALGNEGFAISADRKYAYFFPGDVPGGQPSDVTRAADHLTVGKYPPAKPGDPLNVLEAPS